MSESDIDPYLEDILENVGGIEGALDDVRTVIAQIGSRRHSLSGVIHHAQTVRGVRDLQEEIDGATNRCDNVRFMAATLCSALGREREEAKRRSQEWRRERQKLLDDGASTAHAYVAAVVRHVRGEGRPIALVLGSDFFGCSVITDGLLRREKEIDGYAPRGVFQVYFDSYAGKEVPVVSQPDSDHLLIRTHHGIGASLFDVAYEHASYVYCHSAYHFDPQLVGGRTEIPVVFEPHGIPPEEMEYLGGENLENVAELSRRERAALERAVTVVSVTRNMEHHLRSKYPDETAHTRFIHMPTVSEANIRERSLSGAAKRPTCVYAGGVQRWQLVDEMFDAMAAQPQLCDYRLFIPQDAPFDTLWGDRVPPDSLVVGSRTRDELDREYRSCDYGFVLRNDSVVNRVACPTKIVEYLVFGIVPVMRETDIGDFGRLGIRAVSIDDFRAGRLPGPAERAEMVEANYVLVGRIVDEYRAGAAELQALLAELAGVR